MGATARLWDAATGIDGHTGLVQSTAFSPDRTRVVTTSADKTARLWDVTTGKALATPEGHTEGALSAASSLDGCCVVTSSADKTARLWRIVPTTQALIDHAKRVVPRCLTQVQLRQFYLPEKPLRWCITATGLEPERDPQKWRPLWPYHTPQ